MSRRSGCIVPTMRAADDVVARRVDDLVVIVHLGTDQVFTLSTTGSRYWELLSSGLDPETIVRTLVSEFDVDAATVRADIDRLVAELTAEGLVVEANGD